MLPRRTASRIGSTRSKSSEVRQRVISARLIRYKNLQNQLADALQHISVNFFCVFLLIHLVIRVPWYIRRH